MSNPSFRYFPQNWENGMKLDAGHFRHLEDSIEDSDRDIRAVMMGLSSCFGLLPDHGLQISQARGAEQNSLRLSLENCRAILPGGYRVEILSGLVRDQQIPLQVPSVDFVPVAGVRYHLFLVVRGGQRVPAGIPLTRPIRNPYLVQECHLECIPHDKVQAAIVPAPDRMKIGEWQDGKLSEGYIPAILSVRGFPLALKWYQYFQSQLDAIVRFGTQIIQEYRVKDPNRVNFCTTLLQFIRSNQGRFKWQIPDQPPIALIAYFGDLAGLTENLLDTMDRDFVRNQLRDGQNHQLRACIKALLLMPMPPMEESATIFQYIKLFSESLHLTVKGLGSFQGYDPNSGLTK